MNGAGNKQKEWRDKIKFEFEWLWREKLRV